MCYVSEPKKHIKDKFSFHCIRLVSCILLIKDVYVYIYIYLLVLYVYIWTFYLKTLFLSTLALLTSFTI